MGEKPIPWWGWAITAGIVALMLLVYGVVVVVLAERYLNTTQQWWVYVVSVLFAVGVALAAMMPGRAERVRSFVASLLGLEER